MGRAEQQLETRLVQRAGLGQEGEDPAAVVVHHHDGQVDVAAGRAQQAVGVVEQGDVADQQDGGTAVVGSTAAWANGSPPPRPRWTPPRRSRWHRGWPAPSPRPAARRTTPDPAPASTRRPPASPPSGRAASTSRAMAGSVGWRWRDRRRRSTRRPPRPAWAQRSTHALGHRLGRGSQGRHGRAHGPGRPGHQPVQVAVRVVAGAVRLDGHLPGVEPGQPLTQHLGRRWRAQSQHDLGSQLPGQARDPQERVEVADGAGLGQSTAAAGIGQHRPTEHLGQGVDARRVLDPAAGHDHPTPPAERRPASTSRVAASGAAAICGRCQGRPWSRPGGSVAGPAHQRDHGSAG